MEKLIKTAKLKTWIKNFKETAPNNVETISAVIDLQLLNTFITEAEKLEGFSAVRVYFIRYDSRDNLNSNSTFIKSAPVKLNGLKSSKAANLSQVSLAFVPVKDFNPETLAGKDITENREIYTLAICHPDDYDVEYKVAKGSGLCPPKCGR